VENWIEQITKLAGENSIFAYVILFFSALIENVFPPIPGDTVTLIGAYFVGRGTLSFGGVLAATSLGSVAGFMLLYYAAVYFRGFILDESRNKWIDSSKIERVNKLFAKYGYGIILANRFLSGIRSMISISAGIANLNTVYVAVFATISALVWNGIIIYLGAFIGRSWQEIQQFINTYNKIVVSLLIVIAIFFIVKWAIKRYKRKSTTTDQEV
jgi:membrane protein DedA with SNARE-associated domain